MMIAWMTYCSVIAAFTVAAAALLEPLVRARRLPLRAVWVAAIGASVAAAGWGTRTTTRGRLVVPATAGVHGDATRTAPDVVPTAGSPETAPRARMSTPVTGAVAAVLRSRTTDLALAALWAATSLLAIATLLHSAHRLRRMRRGWREGLFEDTTVLVSDDVGPAVVGLIHPRIVVPAWALGIEGDARRLILSHEREHIRAGDGRLLVAVAVLVRLLPWCLPLWLGERRLRDAIELDCDRRVVRDRADRRRYCALLLDVGARTLSGTAPVPALAEPARGLERRIDAMTMGARVTTRVLGAAVAGGCWWPARVRSRRPAPRPLPGSRRRRRPHERRSPAPRRAQRPRAAGTRSTWQPCRPARSASSPSPTAWCRRAIPGSDLARPANPPSSGSCWTPWIASSATPCHSTRRCRASSLRRSWRCGSTPSPPGRSRWEWRRIHAGT